MSTTTTLFWHAFFLTIGGCGLALALTAFFFAIAHLRPRPDVRAHLLLQSQREKALHLENIALRRRIGWLERRLYVPSAAFAPDALTVEHPTAFSDHE